MLDQTFGACDQQPELCAQIADQLKAGTSQEAIAALYSNAIGIGLRLGSMMGGNLLNAQVARMPAGGQGHGSGPQYPRAINCRRHIMLHRFMGESRSPTKRTTPQCAYTACKLTRLSGPKACPTLALAWY